RAKNLGPPGAAVRKFHVRRGLPAKQAERSWVGKYSDPKSRAGKLLAIGAMTYGRSVGLNLGFKTNLRTVTTSVNLHEVSCLNRRRPERRAHLMLTMEKRWSSSLAKERATLSQPVIAQPFQDFTQ